MGARTRAAASVGRDDVLFFPEALFPEQTLFGQRLSPHTMHAPSRLLRGASVACWVAYAPRLLLCQTWKSGAAPASYAHWKTEHSPTATKHHHWHEASGRAWS